MDISKISINYSPKINTKHVSQSTEFKNNNTNDYETSLYNKKGVTPAFCGCAQASNIFDKECIRLLRKIRRNNNCRKFTEQDIQKFINVLQKEPDASKRPEVLEDAFRIRIDDRLELFKDTLHIIDNDGKEIPTKLLTDLVSLVAGKSDETRYAILNFAKYELETAVKPMQALFDLPANKQNKLIKLLEGIENVDWIPSKGSKNNKYPSESLYDTFRVLLYAEDDLKNAKAPEVINKIKVEAMQLLRDDIKLKKEQYTNTDQNLKEKYYKCLNEIFTYAIDEIL